MHLKGEGILKETDLIEKVQEGNLQAFEQLFEIYKHKALRTVYLMTGDKALSEDIVQEAFVTCYRSIKGLKKTEYFKTWFFKLLTRMTWHYMKKEKKYIPTEDIIGMAETYSKESWIVESNKKETSSELYEEILKLDIKLQTTVILYYYNNFTVKEIAKIMSCLEGTVKSRLHTARKKLKMSLIEQESCMIPKEVLLYENK